MTDRRIDQLQDTIEEMRLQIAELKALVADHAAPVSARTPADVGDSAPLDSSMSRRGALRAAGVLAAGAIAGGAGVLATAAPAAALQGVFAASGPASAAVFADATAGAVGVDASATDVDPDGVAIKATSMVGRAAILDGPTQLGFRNTYAFSGFARPGGSTRGDVIFDADANLWLCVLDGSPGTWRKISGPRSAGSFHAITPARVYDSRPSRSGVGPMIATEGVGAPGLPRSVYVGDSIVPSTGAFLAANVVPDGARAIAANVTVTNTVNSGYLSINPGGDNTAHASTINWSTSGLTIANGVVLTLNDYRELTVLCGPAAATPSANVLIDVTGYWL